MKIKEKQEEQHPKDCKGCPDCNGIWVCKCGLEFNELNTEHKCKKELEK